VFSPTWIAGHVIELRGGDDIQELLYRPPSFGYKTLADRLVYLVTLEYDECPVKCP
jgi:hypothetical protein